MDDAHQSNTPQPNVSENQIEQHNEGSMQGGMQSIIGGNNNTQVQDNRTYNLYVFPIEHYDPTAPQKASDRILSRQSGVSRNAPSARPHSNQGIEDLESALSQGFVEPSIPGSQLFEFTVVMVNASGRELIRRQRQARYLIEPLGLGTEAIEMVIIPGGKLLMGAPSSEIKRFANDEPQHWVTIKPFLMSKYPITKRQWKAVTALPKVYHDLTTPRTGANNHPVTEVSWLEAIEFCNRLSQKAGHVYRLPTEAEWEFACRAGTKTPFHFGETVTSDLANYDGRYPYYSGSKGTNRGKTTPVGEFQVANAFGLFDMHGNVFEWCLDHWHENYEGAPSNGEAWIDSRENQLRVIRGGSWKNEALLCRSAHRRQVSANEKARHVGFRIIRSLEQEMA